MADVSSLPERLRCKVEDYSVVCAAVEKGRVRDYTGLARIQEEQLQQGSGLPLVQVCCWSCAVGDSV